MGDETEENRGADVAHRIRCPVPVRGGLCRYLVVVLPRRLLPPTAGAIMVVGPSPLIRSERVSVQAGDYERYAVTA